jgi:hypothetical protein
VAIRPCQQPCGVFLRPTLAELSAEQFHHFLEDVDVQPIDSEATEGVENLQELVLEKYLEDFIVSNFPTIFKGRLKIYGSPDLSGKACFMSCQMFGYLLPLAYLFHEVWRWLNTTIG